MKKRIFPLKCHYDNDYNYVVDVDDDDIMMIMLRMVKV